MDLFSLLSFMILKLQKKTADPIFSPYWNYFWWSLLLANIIFQCYCIYVSIANREINCENRILLWLEIYGIGGLVFSFLIGCLGLFFSSYENNLLPKLCGTVLSLVGVYYLILLSTLVFSVNIHQHNCPQKALLLLGIVTGHWIAIGLGVLTFCFCPMCKDSKTKCGAQYGSRDETIVEEI